MRTLLFLSLLALAGCESFGERSYNRLAREATEPKSACFRLEVCTYSTSVGGDRLTVMCVAGFDPLGNRTGEVHRFLDRPMLETWSTLNPQAKVCP